MKMQLTFKTPDVIFNALLTEKFYSEEEKNKAVDVIKKFVENEEYVFIEIDTETETAIVHPV